MYSLRSIIEASLERLKRSTSTLDDIREACVREQTRLNRNFFRLPSQFVDTLDGYRACRNSINLLRRSHPVALESAVPIETGADGNCLYRAVSRVLYGLEEAHLALRWLTALVVGTHPEEYDTTSASCRQLLAHPLVVCPPVIEVFKELATP